MKYSQITEKTFDFFESCCEEEVRPIFIISPSKKNLSISLSTKILKKIWIQDLNEQPNSFNKDDIIRITIPPYQIDNNSYINLLVKVVSTNNTNIKITFKQDDANTEFKLNINWLYKYGKVTTNDNNLSSSKRFIDCFNKLRKADVANNLWTQFLCVNDTVTKAQLLSKVYLIVGRGNVDFSKKYIEDFGLYDTIKDGLIIKESLKDLADRFANNQEKLDKMNNFIQMFNNFFCEDFEPDEYSLNESLNVIRENLLTTNIEKNSLNYNLEQLKDDLSQNGYFDKLESLNNIIKLLPDVNSNTIDINVIKSVVIDGIYMTSEYINTIRNLIENKIPVVVLTDYANYTLDRKEITKIFLKDFPHSYILNWNKSKISSLDVLDIDNQLIDKDVLNYCRKYLNQKINIEAFNDTTNIIDKFFVAFEIRGILRNIEGFEAIKNIYTINLRPVVYWLKNIPGQIDITNVIIESINSFKEIYYNIYDQINIEEPEIVALLDEFLVLFNAGTKFKNSKNIINLPEKSYFFNQIFFQFGEMQLPLPNNEGSTYVFTGTPFEEVKYFYLRKSAFEDFDNIYFLGFCKEAENVYNRFLNDTYNFNNNIKDNIPNSFIPFWNISEGSENTLIYLNEECSNTIKNEDDLYKEYNFDKTQVEIELDRYRQNYKSEETSFDNEPLKSEAVNVLELEGNRSVFLKKRGGRRLFVLKWNNDFISAHWDEINPGDRVFTYSLTRQDALKMRGKNSIDESVFEDMDFWYYELKKMLEKCNNRYSNLSDKLKSIKNKNGLQEANPEAYNIRNWLRDDRIINVPDRDNLWVILIASEVSNTKEHFKKIMTAKRKVEKLDDNNREAIKKQINKYNKENKIEVLEEFTISINSIPIVIKHGIVKHKFSPTDLTLDQDKIGIIIKF